MQQSVVTGERVQQQAAAGIPPVPADIASGNCGGSPYSKDPSQGLTDEEIRRGWSHDRLSNVKLRSCLSRMTCLYRDVRKNVGGYVNEPVCRRKS